MSDYFFSDVHLRGDRPERGRRLVRFLKGVEDRDRLFIVGDLCDFWMGSRLSHAELARDQALSALAAFRSRGGELSILPGNHDAWLTTFYRDALRAAIVDEPADVESHGLRLRIVHGHLLGARRKWKAAMESRAFFEAFGRLPGPAARLLDGVLQAKNRRGLADDEARHLKIYREYADGLDESIDLAIFGHVHRAVDQPGRPRLIVLGGWQSRASYLKIDASGAGFHILDGDDPVGEGAATGRGPNHDDARAVTFP